MKNGQLEELFEKLQNTILFWILVVEQGGLSNESQLTDDTE